MVHGGDDEKEPPTCLCGQAQAGHGEIEGDLVQGTDVGTLVFSSVRAVGLSTDSGWALDAVMLERRRIVAKCFMLIEREGACLFVSARKQVAGPEDYSDGSGSPEVGAQGGLGLHVRQKCQSFLCGLPAARQTGADTVHSDEEAA